LYSIRAGLKIAISRINQLISNGHDSEALVTSVFTMEKVLQRTLKQLVISSGFTSKATNILMEQIRGAHSIKDVWSCFDPEGIDLPIIIGKANWLRISRINTISIHA